MRPTSNNRLVQRGFTLVELIMVIVIMGVIGGMVSVFMKSPIDAYFSSGRRAALTDVADTTARRIGRDLRTALPNSIRTPGAACVQFIPTKTGGRYRADDTADGLDFTVADNRFTMLGSNAALPVAQRIAAGDLIVVYNLGPGINDAYALDNWTTVSAAPTEPNTYVPQETVIPINNFRFPLASGSNRFHVVPGAERVVTYICTGAALNAQGQGAGTLWRDILPLAAAYPQPAACPAPSASAALLANHLSACSFNYTGSDLQRNALVSMNMQMSDSGETMSLQHEVHVNNTP